MVYWAKSHCADFLWEEFDYVYVDAYGLSFPNCLKYRHFWTLKIQGGSNMTGTE